MVAKFVFVLAGIVAVMAALVAIPNIMQPPVTGFVEYRRTHIPAAGEVAAGGSILAVASDGSATFSVSGSSDKKFSLTSEELGRIKGLVLETGFMQIPKTDYPAREGAADYTAYLLTVTAEGKQKTIRWVSPGAHDGTIPPIILNVGAQLDDLIERKTI